MCCLTLDWNNVNSDYTDDQVWFGKAQSRYASDWMNTKKVFLSSTCEFIVNASWTNKIKQYTSVYGIFGKELNSSAYGDYSYDTENDNLYIIDLNSAIAANEDASKSILMNKNLDKNMVLYRNLNFKWSRKF
ncbi:MAG: hypothetical protein R2771_13980 [Saprospiraceae bacterium]